jgi:hypothetical protein
MVTVLGEKLIVSVDTTVVVTFEYPVADAVITADPNATPFTLGCDAGVVLPAEIEMLIEVAWLGPSVTMPGLPVVRVMITLDEGAVDKLTFSVCVPPTPT